MTPDEARAVLASAKETWAVQQWQQVYDLLFPVHEEQVLTGAEQGDAAFLLGDACRGLESWDAAARYYNEATTTASSESQARARQRLTEIGRHDAAVAAEDDGVLQGEAAAALAAGDDALAWRDFDGALAHYRAVYDGVVDGKPKYQAALGAARACAYSGNLDEAAQFADYVVDLGDASLAAEAKSLLAWISTQRSADAASSDGTTPDEYKELVAATQEAYFSGAFDQALALFVSAMESERLAGVDRAKMAFNAGMCQRFLGNDAEARELFEYAVAHGPDTTVAKAKEHIAKIDRMDAATELVAELAPD